MFLVLSICLDRTQRNQREMMVIARNGDGKIEKWSEYNSIAASTIQLWLKLHIRS